MKHPHRLSISILPASAVSLALAGAFPVHAAETELAPVIVTADRVARSADDTLVPVTVITRADIERAQARSLDQLLAGLPGVGLTNNGGRGKQTSLFLRGTNSDHILVLVDGIKIGSATLGTAPLQDLPLDQVERIELVRGPRASLYGSEAIGGVLQIFTRKGGGKTAPSFSLGGGSRGTVYGSANLAGGGDAAWYNLGVGGERTSGIDAMRGTENDLDGFRTGSVALRGGYRFGRGTSLELQALGNYGRSEFDGSYQNGTKTRQQVFGATLRLAPAERWQSQLRVGESRDHNDNFHDTDFISRFDTARDSVSWQNDLTLAEGHLLTAGIDFLRDRVSSTTVYDRRSIANKALFAQYSAQFGALDVQLAARADDNDQFGQHNSGSVGVGYTVSDALRLRASHGTAFKAPSINDLYYVDPWGSSGNPDLKPEKAATSELGATGKLGSVGWEANLFRTTIRDMIQWEPAFPGSFSYSPTNVSKARITGLELSARTEWLGTRFAATLTLQDPENRNGPNAGKQLPRRARQIGRLDVDRDFGKWRLGASLSGQGTRYDEAANATRLGGYAIVDVRGEYAINEAWRLQARVENLLDKRYETVNNYNQPGLGAYLTLRYQPK